MSIYRIRTGMNGVVKFVMFGFLALIFIVGAIGYFSGGFGGSNSAQGPAQDNKVIARINGAELTRSQYETAWNNAVEQARGQGQVSSLQSAQMRASIFQQLVSMQLLLSTADSMGVDISKRSIEDQIDKIVVAQLKQSRQAVLGKISKEEEKLDPRDDKEYKSALGEAGSSIGVLEKDIRSKVPEDQIRAQIAQEGILKMIKKKVGRVNDDDIMNSYNAYKIRQIVLMSGKTPESQLQTRAEKIFNEAKKGTDFAQLAKENSETPDKANGGQAVYSFDSSFMFPPDVRKAIESMKVGDISDPVKTQYGYYIVKLEDKTAKPPAKLDSKTKAQRKKAISQEREYTQIMALQTQMKEHQDVRIYDPELLGYWHMYKANEAMTNPAEHANQLDMAVSALQKARKSGSNYSVSIMLAQLLDQQGQTNEAVKILYPMLESNNTVEGADLRMILGDMLIKSNEKDAKAKALQQYQTASEIAGVRDMGVHQQLIEKFKAIGKPDLAAKEQKTIDDYQKQMAEFQARQKAAAKAGAQPLKTGK